MLTVAPEAIQAREDSRRACLRIRCRRGCMPEGTRSVAIPLASTASGACDLAPGRRNCRIGKRALHIRAFYARPCILTHGSLDFIVHRAQPFPPFQ
jgi:hypothetical protein